MLEGKTMRQNVALGLGGVPDGEVEEACGVGRVCQGVGGGV